MDSSLNCLLGSRSFRTEITPETKHEELSQLPARQQVLSDLEHIANSEDLCESQLPARQRVLSDLDISEGWQPTQVSTACSAAGPFGPVDNDDFLKVHKSQLPARQRVLSDIITV